MEPLSALIGSGMSLFGGLMSSASQRAINQANVQQSQWSAEGGYLPGLIANAKAAGINPLAVLGQHAPAMAMQVGTDPGRGLEEAGSKIAQIDPFARQAAQTALEKGKAEVAALNAQITNSRIEAARNQYALDQLRLHPEYLAPGNAQPASQTSFPAPQAAYLGSLIPSWLDSARAPVHIPLPDTPAAGSYSTP